jgi:3-deoxy-manno-octulosonate cytidylyltransferase (CMP-KDO synthetase)
MNYAVIIPARFESSRFPGKPLADLAGKTMIHRVWERCADAVGHDHVYIATDSREIVNSCQKFTSNILMTAVNCLTGTDRVAQAADRLNLDFAINVQGDEPLIDPGDILKVKIEYEKNPSCIVNAMCPINSPEEFRSLTVPKVVTTPSGKLMYMSRAPIPGNKSGEFNWGFKQVCIYAFPAKALGHFARAQRKSQLEEEEDIEILRFLELGYSVRMVEVAEGPVAVDTPSDLEKVIEIINALGG